MLSLSYTISPHVAQALNSIDTQRRQILLASLSPATERQLRWQMLLFRLSWIPLPEEDRLEKTILADVLRGTTQTKRPMIAQIYRNYRDALHYIYETWLASRKPVKMDAVEDLTRILSTNIRRYTGPSVDPSLIDGLFGYLQTQKDHPVVTAAIAYSQWQLLAGTDSLLAPLIAYIFLYKYGYDIRDMITFEQFLARNPRQVHTSLDAIKTHGTSNLWIECFTQAVDKQSQHIFDSIKTYQNSNKVDIYITITDRQRKILSIVADPTSTITNKKVQSLCKISQITASRDLAKLAALGLLYSHGKGRSVYYVKG